MTNTYLKYFDLTNIWLQIGKVNTSIFSLQYPDKTVLFDPLFVEPTFGQLLAINLGVGWTIFLPTILYSLIAGFLCLFLILWSSRLERNIGVQKSALEKLLSQNSQLKTNNSVRTEFIYLMAHELKNPLNQLSMLVSNFDTVTETKQVPQHLTNLENELYSTKVLLNGLLEWAFASRNTLEISKGHTDLNKLVVDTIHYLEFFSKSNKVGFELFSTIKDPVLTCGNVISLIVRNLLINAVKYSSSGRKVAVSCFANRSKAIISVKDYGNGIDSRLLKKILNKEYHSQNNGNDSGSGIGLLMCGELAELINAKIIIKSMKNTGSTFFLVIDL